jgi:plastocyanin
MRAGLPTGPGTALCLLVAATLGASSAGAAGRTYTVTIDKMRFGPAPATLRRGDVILWVNRDLFRHTATARDRSFDLDLPAGASGRTIVRKAGSLAFYCRFHPGMTGQIKVLP